PERRKVHVLTDCDADLVGPYRANHKFPSRREARLQPRYEMVLGVVGDELARRREQPGAILLMIALEQRHTGEQVDRIVRGNAAEPGPHSIRRCGVEWRDF